MTYKVHLLLLINMLSALTAQGASNAHQNCQQIERAYSFCTVGGSSPISVSGNTVTLVENGKSILVPCSDGQRLDFYTRVDNMDIASILETDYPTGPSALPGTSDAGRLRNETLTKSVYGSSPSQVESHLRTVHFLNMNIRFNEQNGAANELEDAGHDITAAIKADPEFARTMQAWSSGKNRGSYLWRPIAGTTVLSSHSFGIAVDFMPVENGLPEYWRWKKSYTSLPEKDVSNYEAPPHISKFPQKLVDIFEKHGFIYGGKWNHFDSMHFEYRPEFFKNFQPRCGASGSRDTGLSPANPGQQ